MVIGNINPWIVFVKWCNNNGLKPSDPKSLDIYVDTIINARHSIADI